MVAYLEELVEFTKLHRAILPDSMSFVRAQGQMEHSTYILHWHLDIETAFRHLRLFKGVDTRDTGQRSTMSRSLKKASEIAAHYARRL